MSAEGKKKRGLAGQANAKNIAFRYGGSKCNYTYYDEGWNDCLKGIQYNFRATLSWRDGWRDCNELISAGCQPLPMV